MAIVNNGTLNGLPAEKLPIGYTLPTATLIPDFHYIKSHVVSLPVSSTASSTAVATMGAIVSGVTTAVTTLLNAELLTSATITGYTVINSLTTTFAPSKNNTTQAFLNKNTALNYLVRVTIYIKAI